MRSWTASPWPWTGIGVSAAAAWSARWRPRSWWWRHESTAAIPARNRAARTALAALVAGFAVALGVAVGGLVDVMARGAAAGRTVVVECRPAVLLGAGPGVARAGVANRPVQSRCASAHGRCRRQRWWGRRSLGLPVQQVLLLGPAGDVQAHYQGLMAERCPHPSPRNRRVLTQPMLRCAVSLSTTPSVRRPWPDIWLG